MAYPTKDQFKAYFAKLPIWVVPLIIVLLFGRFVLILIWHWLH